MSGKERTYLSIKIIKWIFKIPDNSRTDILVLLAAQDKFHINSISSGVFLDDSKIKI